MGRRRCVSGIRRWNIYHALALLIKCLMFCLAAETTNALAHGRPTLASGSDTPFGVIAGQDPHNSARQTSRIGPRDHAEIFFASGKPLDGWSEKSVTAQGGRMSAELLTVGDSPKVPASACSVELFEVNEMVDAVATARFVWGSLSAQDVLRHVIPGVSAPSFAQLPLHTFHNVDGRTSEPVIATMGADIGEFLLALNAFERFLAGGMLEHRQVLLMLHDYLLYTDIPFIGMQVDDTMIENLCIDVGCCPNNCTIDGDGPESEMQERVLKALKRPSTQGCAHFRHLIEHPEEFDTRKELTTAVVRAFFQLLWQPQKPLLVSGGTPTWAVRRKLSLQFMSGPHREQALLHVRTAGCHPNRVPLIAPQNDESSILVIHDTAAQLRRTYNAEWLVQQAYGMQAQAREPYDRELLVAKMDEIAGRQHAAALKLGGGRLPVFSIDYPSACCN